LNRIVDLLLTDLRYLLADLGNDSGLIGPSLYDTAQVVRLAPPAAGIWSALDWLRDQQQPDGGWGLPTVPHARDVPTLAIVLALHRYGTRARDRSAVEAGLAFLRRQAPHWHGALPLDLPVGVELLLPRLLADARDAGLQVPTAPYSTLIALGQQRLRLIAQTAPRAGTTPAHSWEAWGHEPDRALLDTSGGVGHSPAASAAWLHASTGRADLGDACVAAEQFLEAAGAATGLDLPGVVPTVWPIPYFEQSFALYPLLLAGIFDHPALAGEIARPIDALRRGLGPRGIGMSDDFMQDGDITAVSVALLAAYGAAPDAALVRRFAHPDSGMFVTYPTELQPSLSTTIHAAHALTLLGQPPAATLRATLEQRAPDGRWVGDKWHAAWLYLTGHALRVLLDAGQADAAAASLPALFNLQYADGSWSGQLSTLEETAHGALALLALDQHQRLPEAGQQALQRAADWMFRRYHLAAEEHDTLWIGKELYRPRRVARAFELAAMLGCALSGYGL
jgi:hypothetical protein